jgi:hypothetical protein
MSKFNWQDYYTFACLCLDKNNPCFQQVPIASKRSSVSRNYYAVFCLARNKAEERFSFKKSSSPEDHESIRRIYNNNNNSGIANSLNTLRKMRNDCDYKDVIDESKLDIYSKKSNILTVKIINSLQKI